MKTEQEDKLDETRSNEAHLRHVVHQQDPRNIQGPCPSKPLEGLEQCLPWHQRAWGRLTHGCSCHRRRIVRPYNEDQPPRNTTLSRIQWLTYMQDIAFPISSWSLGRDSMRRVERTIGVPPYSAGMDMRSSATTSNVDRISETVHGALSTRRTEHEKTGSSVRLRGSSGVSSTYLASRPLLGGDGQDSEGIAGYGQRLAHRMTRVEPTMSRTSDHEDSRRLASGLSADLSSAQEEDSGFGRQTDPGDRRTSDWRSQILGSDSPSTGRPMRVTPTLIGSSSDPHQQMQQNEGLERSHRTFRETEGDTAGNASRILMTGLRHPGQRGVTTPISAWLRPVIPNRLMMLLSGTDTRRNIGNPDARYHTWLWAKLLQEEYPSEGYSMNTRSTPREVEALQARAREYTQQQVEQMDEWERALYREWTSLISWNALAFPYPMESESEAQTLIATPIHGYVESGGGSASSTDILVPGFHDRPHMDCDTNPLLRKMEGTLEDGPTTSGSTQTTIASRTWNSDTLPRGTVLRRDRRTGRTRIRVTGEPTPEEEEPLVSAINVGTLKATTSDEDKYCMLDSGANVMVVPLMRNMQGDKTVCSLVGDKKTQGLIISRLYTETRTYLVVAVENASVLLPPAYLIRIAGYKLAWENVPGGEYFKLRDGYGEPVAVQEDDDLLFLGKNTLWRVGHDMYQFAQRQTGRTWSEIWEQLTGESLTIQAITSHQTDQSVDFVELFHPGNFKEQKSSLVAGGTYDVHVNPAIDLTRESVRQQVRKDIEREDPLILLGAPPCTVFSPMQNINQKHHIGDAWEKKKQEGMELLIFATQCYWDQIERGMFFLHEHPATASSWGIDAVKELEAHPGVHVVTSDMCRWGMRVRDEIPEDQGQPYLVKKPTKWMTNCRLLAELLSLRCDGTHSHMRLEGGMLTKRAASYPVSLVRDILKVVVKVKQLAKTANYPKDPAHVTIPESLQESERCVQVAYTQNTLQAYDTRTPRAIPWDSVVVRRTINRKTGVVMAEDYAAELTEVTLNRPFKGHSPKEVLTVFFYWDPERTDFMVNHTECSLDLELYLSITSELLNLFLNDPQLAPRSSYRKAIGEGVRTITYGAHTSLAALQKSHRFVTNITTADNHQPVLLLCHKLATLMPRSIPYLCITVVVLTTGEDLAPHRDIRNHRHFRNATISNGKREGGVHQTYEDDIWVNQDSRDQWVILDARNTFHRVTSVEGDRVSIIYHTPQHLDRLRHNDWNILRDAGFPVDQLWEGGLLKEPSEIDDEDCPQEQIMTVRQTSPTLSEGEIYMVDELDLDANSVFRPTLQAVLWLSELIATTTLKKEKVTKKGPKLDPVVTTRAMHDIVAQAQ